MRNETLAWCQRVLATAFGRRATCGTVSVLVTTRSTTTLIRAIEKQASVIMFKRESFRTPISTDMFKRWKSIWRCRLHCCRLHRSRWWRCGRNWHRYAHYIRKADTCTAPTTTTTSVGSTATDGYLRSIRSPTRRAIWQDYWNARIGTMTWLAESVLVLINGTSQLLTLVLCKTRTFVTTVMRQVLACPNKKTFL